MELSMTDTTGQKEIITVDFSKDNPAAHSLQAAVLEFIAAEKSRDDLHARVMSVVEEPLIREVLRITYGNQIRAAQILGLNRNTLRKKMHDMSIHPRPRKNSRQGL
jgi:DNA-binding protein Fis